MIESGDSSLDNFYIQSGQILANKEIKNKTTHFLRIECDDNDDHKSNESLGFINKNLEKSNYGTIGLNHSNLSNSYKIIK